MHEHDPNDGSEGRRTNPSVRSGRSSKAHGSLLPAGLHYWLGGFARFLYLGVLFAYLLALVATLFEAQGYQQLVARLGATVTVPSGIAPDDWRRMLLLAVRDADRVGCGAAGRCYAPEFLEQAPWSAELDHTPGETRDPRVRWIRKALLLSDEPGVIASDSDLFDLEIKDAVTRFRASQGMVGTPLTDDALRKRLIERVRTVAVPCPQTALTDASQLIRNIMTLGGDKQGSDGMSARAAETMYRAYQDLDRFRPILMPFTSAEDARCGRGLGFDGKDLAVAGSASVDLLVVFIMGAIGSLIYITQYLLRQATQGQPYTEGAGRSWAWLLFRPVFGIAIAFTLFLLYKAGQIALGGGSETPLSADVNLPVLGTLSLFAGLMSWQVLDMVEARGRRFLVGAQREKQWATGLAVAMERAGCTGEQLAVAVGVSKEQVGRWLEYIESVSPEMQDRLMAHFDSEASMLFSDEKPTIQRAPRFVVNLGPLMDARQIDAADLAYRLNVPTDLVDAWRSGVQPVAERYQRDLVLLLDTNLEILFGRPESAAVRDAQPTGAGSGAQPTPGQPGGDSQSRWAVGLRRALEGSARFPTSAELASHLGIARETVRDWMELREAVPPAEQDALTQALQADASLFADAKPNRFERVIDADGLLAAIAAGFPRFADDDSARIAAFATLIDVGEAHLEEWLGGHAPIAPETAGRIRRELTGTEVGATAFLVPFR